MVMSSSENEIRQALRVNVADGSMVPVSMAFRHPCSGYVYPAGRHCEISAQARTNVPVRESMPEEPMKCIHADYDFSKA